MSVCTLYSFSIEHPAHPSKKIMYARITDERNDDWSFWMPEDLPECYVLTEVCGIELVDERRQFMIPPTRI
jgi:hypothetical protein